MSSTRVPRCSGTSSSPGADERVGIERVTIEVRPPFRLDLTVWALRRRPHNTIDAWDGTTYTRTLVSGGAALQVAVRQEPSAASGARLVVEVRRRARRPPEAAVEESRRVVERMLGVHVDLSGFYALAAADDRLAALVALPGIGRWSAEYVLLRGLGRLEVLPGGDVGARKSLRRRFDLPSSAGYDEVAALAERWRPYGGLVYFHLLLDGLARSGRLGEARGTPGRKGEGGRTGGPDAAPTGANGRANREVA